MDPIWINISLLLAALLKLEITVSFLWLSLAFIASSFRVTEENLVFETVQSGPYSSFECFFSALKGTHFYILLGFSIRKSENSGFSETTVASDLKISRNRQIIELMKICENLWLR